MRRTGKTAIDATKAAQERVGGYRKPCAEVAAKGYDGFSLA
jgi:hypothetical protein